MVHIKQVFHFNRARTNGIPVYTCYIATSDPNGTHHLIETGPRLNSCHQTISEIGESCIVAGNQVPRYRAAKDNQSYIGSFHGVTIPCHVSIHIVLVKNLQGRENIVQWLELNLVPRLFCTLLLRHKIDWVSMSFL